jgi:hypothetical protein
MTIQSKRAATLEMRLPDRICMRHKFFVLAAASLAIAVNLTAPSFAKSMKACDAEYEANKVAIQSTVETKTDFIAACLAGTEKIPAESATLSSGTPTPKASTPARTHRSTPTKAAKPKDAPAATGGAVAPTDVGGFSTDEDAKAYCPADTVVWVDAGSGVYHFAGSHNYGATEEAAYLCEADAKAAGEHAAKNEKHP